MMKKLNLSLLIACGLSLMMFSCAGDDGANGLQGAQGDHRPGKLRHASAAGQAGHLQALRMTRHEVEGLFADGAGGARHDQAQGRRPRLQGASARIQAAGGLRVGHGGLPPSLRR